MRFNAIPIANDDRACHASNCCSFTYGSEMAIIEDLRSTSTNLKGIVLNRGDLSRKYEESQRGLRYGVPIRLAKELNSNHKALTKIIMRNEYYGTIYAELPSKYRVKSVHGFARLQRAVDIIVATEL